MVVIQLKAPEHELELLLNVKVLLPVNVVYKLRQNNPNPDVVCKQSISSGSHVVSDPGFNRALPLTEDAVFGVIFETYVIFCVSFQ